MSDFKIHPDILNPHNRVVFFPVRHHSPAAARLVRQLALEMSPAAILVEGPADFNDRLDQLALPHHLPIAIYSYTRLPDGARRGAFYPFCLYSPEWQALQVGQELGATIRFIDLPWADIATGDIPTHRYADAELRGGSYVAALGDKLGVENFDDVWDTLFEIDADLSVAEYLKRCHHLCVHIRLTDRRVSPADRQREAFMVEQIRQTLDQQPGHILVVTGGFHSYALFAQLFNVPFEQTAGEQGSRLLPEAQSEGGAGENFSVPADSQSPIPNYDRGIALTPYSYQRLDSLTGYDAGMPNPGFYHQVWQDRAVGEGATYRKLLARTVEALREQKQPASTADLIAVEAMAQGLADLRGHAEVWRRDLIDGIIGALIKDELAYGQLHPFLAAVYEVFRGSERGHLAEATERPPLVHDIRHRLDHYDLEPQIRERSVELDLLTRADLARSRVLYQLHVLGIAGYRRTGGTDLAARTDLTWLWEQWRIQWSPDFEATCIEAAIYGPTLTEAAAARLLERAAAIERKADQAALILLEAALMGLDRLTEPFYQQLVDLIRDDGNFFTVTGALGHLLYLYRYDETLGTAGAQDIGGLLKETFTRGVWLLESLGQVQGQDKALLRGVAVLLETVERCAASLELDQAELVELFQRVGADTSQTPLLRGAVMGALWTLGEAQTEQLIAGVRYFAAPAMLGDYLTGLFHLAREAAQRQPDLVLSIDELLMGYADEEFLEALPALRLAFSYFTPREKHHMARTLFTALGQETAEPLPELKVSPEMAARVLAFEARLFKAVERYGLRRHANG